MRPTDVQSLIPSALRQWQKQIGVRGFGFPRGSGFIAVSGLRASSSVTVVVSAQGL